MTRCPMALLRLRVCGLTMRQLLQLTINLSFFCRHCPNHFAVEPRQVASPALLWCFHANVALVFIQLVLSNTFTK